MKTVQNIVWGVIGGGKVCEKKSMPAMDIIPHSRVKIVMRRNTSACKAFADRHHIPNWTIDSKDILHDPEINAVYIATPPDSHATYTIQAAHAGKAVYVEKPMARNYKECKTMIKACKKADVPLFVAYYRRALPHFLRVKQLLEEGAIGKICSVHIAFYQTPRREDIVHPEQNWRIQPQISGGGHFHDLASHQLDLLDFLFGNIVSVHGITENRTGLYIPTDTLSAAFQFKSGVVGSGSWCFVSPASEEKDDIYILGEKGSLRFSTFAHAHIDITSEIQGTSQEQFELPVHIQELLIRSIVGQLRRVDMCPSTGKTAARTSRVMDIICSNT